MSTPPQYEDKCGVYYGSDVYLSRDQQQFNAQAILNYWTNISRYRWQIEPMCAVLGNMAFESTCNPMVGERGGGGYGLVQWTPKQKLINHAKKIGFSSNSCSTMYAQLKTLDSEVTGGDWIRRPPYNISFKEFIEDTTHGLDWLTKAFMLCYERPRDQSIEAQNDRINGDRDHIGSSEWYTLIDGGSIDTHGSIDGFVNWLLGIASDNQYTYELGANHGVDWDNYLTYKKFDCSSFVSFGLKLGGKYDLVTQFTTRDQVRELTDLGFTKIPFNGTTNQLKKGDIMVLEPHGGESGHTEVISDTTNELDIKMVGAHNDSLPPAEQISEKSFGGNFDYIMRPFNRESKDDKRRRKINPLIFGFDWRLYRWR